MRIAFAGATRGTGRALARAMAERGERLFLLGRDAEQLSRGRIKINGEHICTLKDAFIQAHAGNTDFFLPFREAVYKSYATPEELVEPNGEEDGDAEDQDTPADED